MNSSLGTCIPAFDTVGVLGNGKKYETMSESSSSGKNPVMSTHEDGVNSESETRILTQEEVNEQIRS